MATDDKRTAEVRFGEESQKRTLLCPACGSPFAHQGRVEVWNRPEGETRPGMAIEKDGQAHEIPADGNPSIWRDGVRIWFVCEGVGCEAQFALTVAQHKGETIVEIEASEEVAAKETIRQKLISGRFKPGDAGRFNACAHCNGEIEADELVVWVVVADEQVAVCAPCALRNISGAVP